MGDASSPDEGSNGYGSDLRLGGNYPQEANHFRYVLPSSPERVPSRRARRPAGGHSRTHLVMQNDGHLVGPPLGSVSPGEE